MIYIKEYPSKEYLHSLFSYNDGNLYWKSRDRSQFKTPQGHGAFKARCEGKIARVGKRSGYWIVKINGEHFSVHRIIYIMHFGDLQTDVEVDHIDNCKTNNIISNLRHTKREGNTCNTVLCVRNTSGIKGVSFDKAREKWQAQIKKGDCKIRKRFATIKEAESFIKQEREILHKEFHNHG